MIELGVLTQVKASGWLSYQGAGLESSQPTNSVESGCIRLAYGNCNQQATMSLCSPWEGGAV
jgi:hypothetical protein